MVFATNLDCAKKGLPSHSSLDKGKAFTYFVIKTLAAPSPPFNLRAAA